MTYRLVPLPDGCYAQPGAPSIESELEDLLCADYARRSRSWRRSQVLIERTEPQEAEPA